MVTLTIKPIPPAPTAGINPTTCSNGLANQTITAVASVAGGTVTWWDAPIGGNSVANPVQTGVGHSTYYAESLVNGCTSTSRTSITIEIYQAATALIPPATINATTDDGCTKSHIDFIPPNGNSPNCAVAATGVRLNALGQPDQVNTLSSPFPIGTTTIRWDANVNGQVISTYQSVIVTDNVAPVPNVANLPTITAECSVVVSTIPTATDNCAGTVSATTSSPLSYSSPGTYTIVWVYSDGHGNTATQNQTVIITDSNPPVPNVASLPDLTGVCSVTVSTIPTANDQCAGTITGTTTSALFYNTPGTYYVVWIYNDNHGHAITQQQKVVVSGLTAYNVTSSGSVCNGGVTISLDGAQAGVTYTLYRNGSVQVETKTSATLPFTAVTTAGTYTVIASSNADAGCSTAMTGNVVVNAATLPNVFTVTGGGTYCGSGAGVVISLSGSQANTTYYLMRNGNIQADMKTGSALGFGFDFTAQTIAGTYTVIAANAANCTVAMTGSAQIVTGSVPVVQAITGTTTVCYNGMTQLFDATPGGQWTSDNTAAAIIDISSGIINGVAAGQTTIHYTVTNPCGTTDKTIVVTVTGPASAGSIIGQTALGCPGTQTTFTSSGTQGGQWSTSDATVASVNASTGLVTCQGGGSANITYTVTGCDGVAKSTFVTVTVTPNAVPGTITSQSALPICVGSVIPFNTSGTAGGQWSSDNTTVATVDNSGNVTCKAPGSANIKYTVQGCTGPVSSQMPITVGTPVSIGTQPQSASNCTGTTFTVVASGDITGYQWQNAATSTNITGANTASYTTSTAGSYKVIIFGVCGNVTSNTVTFTLAGGTAPTITKQPVGQTICSGTATLSVTATGATGYQWTLGGVNISGANAASYTTGVAGNYAVVVSGGCNTSVTSNTVALVVGGAPSITTQPVGQTICSGSYTFTVAATGTGLTYQWQLNGSNINKATSSSYTTSTAGNYTVVVKNSCNITATSNVATLVVGGTPTIATQPQGATICSGTWTFSVAANGTGLTYQWQLNGSNILNATGSTYTTGAAGTYRVIVKNSCNVSVTSNNATLVVGGSPSITTQPVGGAICSGTLTLSVVASGTGLTYQWQKNGVNIGSATSSSYGATTSGNYTVIVKNSCNNTVTSNTAVVTIGNAVPGTALVNGYPTSNVCFQSTVTVSLTGNIGNVTRWEYSTNGASWQTISTTATTITRTVTQNTMFRAIVAISASCNATTSSVANAIVTTVGVGGTVTTPSSIVCRGSSVVFTVSGNSGSVIRWEYSTNGGLTWSKDNVSPTTATTLTYVNATQDRRYRAAVNGCMGNTVYSSSVAITTTVCNTKVAAPAPTTPAPPVTTTVVASKFEATAYPNPSQAFFNLQVKSSNSGDVEITVFDISGKLVDKLRGAPYETFRFGNTLVAGTYIVEVRQGTDRITTKVIKL
jgi:hypothetical protein